jgi:hypothetical protein
VKLVLHSTVQGWTTTVVLVALLSSVQLLMIGILGEYVGRIYEQVKQRPLYIARDFINLDRQKDTDDLEEDAAPALPYRDTVMIASPVSPPEAAVPPVSPPVTAEATKTEVS